MKITITINENDTEIVRLADENNIPVRVMIRQFLLSSIETSVMEADNELLYKFIHGAINYQLTLTKEL